MANSVDIIEITTISSRSVKAFDLFGSGCRQHEDNFSVQQQGFNLQVFFGNSLISCLQIVRQFKEP